MAGMATALKASGVDWSELGRRIRELRKGRGLSQAELIEPSGSASYLSLIESGARRPSPEILGHLASRLGVDPEELLTGRSPNIEIDLELRLQETRELLRLGRVDDAVRDAKTLAADAQNAGVRRVEAKCYEVLAGVDEQRGTPDTALEHYRKAESLWSSEPSHRRFQTMAGMGRCHHALGDPRFAVHLLESYLLELDRDGVPDPVAVMRIQATLVNTYSALGLREKAAEYADQAQRLAPNVTDAEQLACMNMNVARSLFERGHVADALDAIRQAELAYLSLGWEVDAARAKLNRGIVQKEKGEVDSARANLTEAARTLQAAEHPSAAAEALTLLGAIERESGNQSGAIALLLEARDLLRNGDFTERAANLRELGLCHRDRDPEESMSQLRRAIDLYVLARAPTEVVATYKLLGDVLRECGRIDESADAYCAGIEAIEVRGDSGPPPFEPQG